MSFDWKKTLASVAPVLGTALGGPLGGLAASVAGKALLGDDKASEDDIKNYIEKNQDPETFLKLKEAENQFNLEIEKIGLEKDKLVVQSEKIAADDRDSARKREADVGDYTNSVLSFVVIGGFLGMAYGVLFMHISVDSALAGTVIGYLSAKAEQVLTYYFGSTIGSKMKTRMLDPSKRKEKDGNEPK